MKRLLLRKLVELSLLGAGACALPLSPARADVLFLDLNDSPKEIEAAQEAAQITHERVFVFPQFDAHQRIRIRNLRNQLEGRASALEKAQEKNYPKELEKAQQQLDEAREQYKAAFGEGVTGNALDRYLSLLEEDPAAEITAMVLSGHHTSDAFWGTLTYDPDKDLKRHIEFPEIFEALDQHPRLAKSLRTLVVLACYGGTRDQVLRWKIHFPDLKIIFGFEGASPGGDFPDSYELLRGLLLKRDALASIDAPQAAERALVSLPYGTAAESAAVFNQYYVARGQKAVDLTDAAYDCEREIAQLRERKGVFDGYLRASTSENVPLNEDASDLRSFYDLLQKYAHCRLPSDLPTISQVVSLIHYREVLGEFNRVFAGRYGAMDETLERLGFASNLRVAPLHDPRTSRRSAIHLLQSIRTALWELGNGKDVDDGAKEVRIMLEWADVLLVRMTCVPATWITREESSPRLPSSCASN